MSKKQREVGRTERAAAVRQEQASQERRRRVLITVAVLAVLAVIITIGVLVSGGDKEPSTATGPKVEARADGQALVVGSDPQATKVVVYEDFLCPYCREFEAASRTTLREAAARGDASVEYRPFHLLQDDYSTLALTAWAAVLEKGTPQQALKFHDLLFENQPYESDSDKPGIKDLQDLARKAGVTDDAVLDAMAEPNQEFVDAANSAASDAGVEGTPTVVYDGKPLVGSPSQLADTLAERLSQ